MQTITASAVLAERYEQLKQKRATSREIQARFAPVMRYEPQDITGFIIKPAAKNWPELQQVLLQVVNLPGFMDSRVKELFDQGYAAELETAAEIALATAKKSPYHLFAAMISRKRGNWQTKTLHMVQTVWEVRRNATLVLDKLNLSADSLKPVLAAAWRLKSSLIRCLGIATEQGTGILNPAGLFFWLTKHQSATSS
ncbi:MAG: hypothetical protein M3Y81_22085 [Chloroflexota bacterium]|nr:hypothetical protein [Chloroflexota bacterium]